MSEFRKLGASPPAIATQAELLQRLRNRDRPQPERAPSPPDQAEHLAAERRAEHERRIAELRNTLGEAHHKVETQHSFARLSGHAKSSFGQER